MHSADVWQIKLVFSRHKTTVIELPPTLSTRRVWQHVRTHYPQCAIHELRRPSRYARRGARE